MRETEQQIIKAAIACGYITELDLESCQETVQALADLGVDKSLLDALKEHRFLSEEKIAKLAHELGVPLPDAARPTAPIAEEDRLKPSDVPSVAQAVEPRRPRTEPKIPIAATGSSGDDAAPETPAPAPPSPPPAPDVDATRNVAPPAPSAPPREAAAPPPPADMTVDFASAAAAPSPSSSPHPEATMDFGTATSDEPPPGGGSGGAGDSGSDAGSDSGSGAPSGDSITEAYEQDLIGQTLGGCQIERLLGKGAMGTVFEATHIALRKKVAVKILNPSRFYQKKQVDQFFREARTAAAIDHQNIVAVHDVGQAMGLYYIVMQFIEGDSLADRMDRERILEPEEAVRIITEAARGLSVAHGAGIIHRDIKPANIMLTLEGGVKIADFGLAQETEEDPNVTGGVEVMGTPAYMSPEQIDGRNVDHRADLYSLGVTLYFITTGRKPFEAATPMEVLLKHMSERLIPPTQVNPRIPKGLGQVIERLMAKDPENRYRDADELIKDLTQVTQGGKPKAVAAMEDVIQRMEELAQTDTTPVRSRQPITAAIISGIVAACCAVLFTVALPDVQTVVPDWQPRVDPYAAEAEAVFQTAEQYARKNPAEIEEIRTSFRKILQNYEDVEPYPTKARMLLRDAEKAYDLLCEEKTKEYRENSARHFHNHDYVPAVLELYEIPKKWLLGSVGREVERSRERVISQIRETTGLTLVPGGRFKAGADKHEEEVRPFLIEITEVSNDQYARFVEETRHPAPAHWPEGRPPEGEGTFPVVGVSYADAQAYASWKHMRLPTALEWEMAARGTDGRIYPWGDRFDQNAVNCQGLQGGLRPVTELSRGRSPYGCLNMGGNAHEWTSTPADGGVARMVRGGAHKSHITNVRTFSEIAVPVETSDPSLAIGFRCVKDIR